MKSAPMSPRHHNSTRPRSIGVLPVISAACEIEVEGTRGNTTSLNTMIQPSIDARVIAQKCSYCGLESSSRCGRKKTCKDRGQQSIIMAGPSGTVLMLFNCHSHRLQKGFFSFV